MLNKLIGELGLNRSSTACRYCGIHVIFRRDVVCGHPDGELFQIGQCSNCSNKTIWRFTRTDGDTIIYPSHGSKILPDDLPLNIRKDVLEAWSVLQLSPKASATLSRRILQHLIHEQENITRSSLAREIDTLLNRNTLPKHLAEDLDVIRNIGNLAAHPTIDTTSTILEVDYEDALFTFEVLESLLRHWFQDLPRSLARREQINIKLATAGKDPIKTPPVTDQGNE